MPELNAWLKKFEGSYSKELSLDRIKPLANKFELNKLPCHVIKIAGTNGKGSAAVSLAKLYHDMGYKTALYTSPHLFRFTERLKINNEEVAERVWCEAFTEIYGADKNLTYFEFVTLAALLIISRSSLDIAILEIGMGGRLDAVNIVNADVAFITSIGMDHTKWLGNTLAEIAREKAAIAANSRCLVCSSRVEMSVIEEAACSSYMLERDFSYKIAKGCYTFSFENSTFKFKVPNIHPDIVAGVLMCLVLGQNNLPFTRGEVEEIMPHAQNLARCNVFNIGPKVLVDVAHNIDSAKYLLSKILGMGICGKIYIIFSSLQDKDVKSIVWVFEGLDAKWHIYQIADKRAMLAADMQEHLCAELYQDAQEAFDDAFAKATAKDLIVAFGSFHVAKDLLLILKNHSSMVEIF